MKGARCGAPFKLRYEQGSSTVSAATHRPRENSVRLFGNILDDVEKESVLCTKRVWRCSYCNYMFPLPLRREVPDRLSP